MRFLRRIFLLFRVMSTGTRCVAAGAACQARAMEAILPACRARVLLRAMLPFEMFPRRGAAMRFSARLRRHGMLPCCLRFYFAGARFKIRCSPRRMPAAELRFTHFAAIMFSR